MDTTWKKSSHSRLHAPLSNHGTVWDMVSIPFGTGNSMIPSVSSDGSVLMACSGDCNHGKYRPPPLQLFRIVEVVPTARRNEASAHAELEQERNLSRNEGEMTHTPDATIIVDCSVAPMVPDATSRIHPLPVAMHRVTSCPGTMLSKSSFYGKIKLIAYGGAVGLVRVHMVHQDMFGKGTTKDLFL